MKPTLQPQDIATSLQQHEETLRRLGLKSLALFGSVAQAAHGPESDLDLLYEFEDGAATLDHLLNLQAFLEKVLGRKVDLVSRKYLSPILRQYIEHDVVPVYDAAVES
jgi:hypothetical protein